MSRALDRRLEGFFAADGPLAGCYEGYSHRPEQLRFAAEVSRALGESGLLLADAPTGTGKSAAYLAAAVLSGKRVVISTATIALQSQLLTKDIPLIRRAVAKLGGYPEEEGFSYAVMKGRGNFLCDQRFEETAAEGELLDDALFERLEDWRERTATGDREELDFPVPVGRWLEVASDGEDCTPGTCPHREGCFYYAHRDRAKEADVVVVNHALLMVNAASWGALLDPAGRHLILDEAHRLEDVMNGAFGARVSRSRLAYSLRQISKKAPDLGRYTQRVENAADLFFDALRENQSLGDEEAAPRGYRQLVDSLKGVREVLSANPKEEVANLQGMVGRIWGDLRSFYTAPQSTHAYAVVAGRSRKSANPYPELRSWLVETGEVFRKEVAGLFDEGGVVLTSATLATGTAPNSSFAYTRKRLGLEPDKLERPFREVALEETFDYSGNALVYVDDGERPGERPGERSAIRRTEELVRLSRGRALILLTTSRAVSDFRDNFVTDYPVRYQGDDSPARLVDWLKKTPNAVLVGTRTFWEGVDVSGEQVSLVVMDKVPFPVPDDPVIAALTQKAGKGWFIEVSLPRAQVAVRQGAGRLLRSATDRGVIAVLDPRIRKKNWGQAVLRSLPAAPVTTSLEEVRRFFGPER